VDIKHWHPLIKTPEFTGFAVGSGDIPVNAGHSVLKAWDPIARRMVWQVETPGISNGGTLSTAGGLVFQGLADGYLHAYSAQNGKDLWSFFAGVAVTGVPIVYSVDGREYLTITSGPLGGTTGAYGAISARWGWDARVHPRRVLTFALDADASLPTTPPRVQAVPLDAPEFHVDPVRAKLGENEYVHCTLCHGMAAVAGGIAPDLRASPVPLSREEFTHVVRDGALQARGMPRFEEMSDEQLEALRHYLRQKARSDLALQPQAMPH
jgi:quinohemoprotein ethanol dehydrogenase